MFNFFRSKKGKQIHKATINISINTEQTPDHFKQEKDIIVPFIYELLDKLNKIEEEAFKTNEEIKVYKDKNGLPIHQTIPQEDDLWNVFKDKYKEQVNGVCSDDVLAQGFGASFGNPPKYIAINIDHTIDFIMKSKHKARVEIKYHRGIDKRLRFDLKNESNKWQIIGVYYGFSNEMTWHKCGI